MTDRPHLWVPYGQDYGCGDAEICTLCGEFLTPATAEAECPETFMDEGAGIPADMPRMLPELETADGTDDELQRGVTKPL
jgi:hypothetical protein